MARIKSALELAMENTAEIGGDKAAIQRKELIEKGKRAASRFLFHADEENSSLEEQLKQWKGEDRITIGEAVRDVLLNNISLPHGEFDEPAFDRIAQGLQTLSKKTKNSKELTKQLKQFLMQFQDNRQQLIQQMKERFGPQIQAKAQELSKQYGQEVKLSPEQDPEFMKMLNQNLARLEDQYNQALTQAKEDLKTIIG